MSQEDAQRLLHQRYRQRRFQRLESVASQRRNSLQREGEALIERLAIYLSEESTSGEEVSLSVPASALGWLTCVLLSEEVPSVQPPPEHLRESLEYLASTVKRLRIRSTTWPMIHPSRAVWVPRRPSMNEDEALEFLKFYDQLQLHPVLDVTVFPACRFLHLDSVPVEWLQNLSNLPLTSLYIEKSHIDSLSAVFPARNEASFAQLSRLVLTYCGLVDSSGFRKQPLLQFQNLTHLSLSHNHLSRSKFLWPNLRLPLLRHLDLSYNCLTTTRRIHYYVGNIQYLDLSHNEITEITHLEKLISLQTLKLHHNRLSDVSSIRCLARLPELRRLTLANNSLPKHYNVEVWSLICQHRLDTVWTDHQHSITLRQLQYLLPDIDGTKPSPMELRALKNRMYRPVDISAILPVQRPPTLRRRQTATCDEGEALHLAPPKQPEPTRQRLPLPKFSDVDVLQSLSLTSNVPQKAAMDTKSGTEDQNGIIETKKVFSVPLISVAAPPLSLMTCQFPDELSIMDVYVKQLKARETPPTENPAVKDSSSLENEQKMDPVPMEGSEESAATTTAASIPVVDDEAVDGGTAEEKAVYEEPDAHTADSVKDGTLMPEMQSTPKPKRNDNRQESEHSSDTPTSAPIPGSSPFALRVVSFPNGHWNDDSLSIPYSTTSSVHDEASLVAIFRAAEARSRFDGPESLKQLYIHENLDLYFRLFVFSTERLSQQHLLSPSFDDDEINRILQTYPKIQLCPVDLRLRNSASVEQDILALKADSREEFRLVWKERVVACGKPALKRLNPNRQARYGFHGELLWSAAEASHLKPEAVVEYRLVMLCLSDVAFYIILDHDKATTKAGSMKKKFPHPVPRDACFVEAKWPHALARHTLRSLKSISIGFAFQRLTLTFENVTSTEREEFCYVLLTSNKVQTVALLKEIQDLTGQIYEELINEKEVPIPIENDDREVLDAMAAAVSPDSIGIIVHYQVLLQYWRSGDRGCVRRAVFLSDTKIYLMDEDYAGDGSGGSVESGNMGRCTYRLVDSANLLQIASVDIDSKDPRFITISIKPLSAFQRNHNWRLICRDRLGSERLADDIKKAIAMG